MKIQSILAAAVYSTFLAACGGGGGGDGGGGGTPANVTPVSNAGPAQSVVTGSAVTLDGTASSDADGDPLTYAWTLTTMPTGSTALLSSAALSKPAFTADLGGDYIISLVVNDGKVSSVPKTVTVTAGAPINPLPVGAGTMVQISAAPFSFYKVADTAGVSAVGQNDSCGSFRATDVIEPSGIVVALSSDGTKVYEIDIRGGVCKFMFTTPTPMKAMAAYRGGAVVTLPNAYVSMVGSDGYLHHFDRQGGVVSFLLKGTSGDPAIPNLTRLDGIDYASNGTLYGLVDGVLWNLDSIGTGALFATGVAGSSDIDIAADNTLRFITNGQLWRLNLANNTVSSVIFDGFVASGAIVSR